jgi:hypothetical protein
MRLQIVSYDLNRPGQDYATLIARLKQLGAQRILYSQWMLRTTMTAEQLRDDLLRFIDATDRILVADVTDAPLAWSNLQVQVKPAFNIA